MESMTLYNIETGLLELWRIREDLLADPNEKPDDQAVALEAIDKAIREHVTAELKKVDNIAGYLRECDQRATILTAEAKRCKFEADHWKKRHDELESLVIAVMQETKQKRLDGRLSVLKLQKNPPSVDVAQRELVPEEYQRATVKMPYKTWCDIRGLLMRLQTEESNEVAQQIWLELNEGCRWELEPEKKRISEELKQPCPKCNGKGEHPSPAGSKADTWPCGECAGTGKRAVPGCRLKTDGVRLVVD